MKLTITAVMTTLMLVSGAAFSQNRLFTLNSQEDKGGAVVKRLEITLSPKYLRAGETVIIELPVPDGTVLARLTPISPRDILLGKDQAAWTGIGDDGSEIFVMRIGNAVEAQIQRRNRAYRIHTLEGARGTLEVLNTRRFREAPNDGLVLDKGDRPKPGGAPDSSCLDAADRIDVMVAYTPAARAASGGTQQIANEIAFAVGRTNLAYSNSNTFHRLNLVSAQEISFTEPAAGVDSNALLGQLQSTSDMVLDTLHGARDAAHADLVSLLYEVDDSSWCGWGYTTESADSDTTDDEGFSVVQRSCAGGNLSFAHELGHNIGARHNRFSAGTSTLGYNFGHVQLTPGMAGVTPWRTVMSYNTVCDDAGSFCERVPWFSNPDVNRQDDATGVPLADTDPEHNVNVFSANDGEVARYRCARNIDTTADVWMKDRWEDTGGEPDAATAGKAMWQSPYIWIRLAEDVTLEHEHEHENPVLGQTNHVYVKQHNDGGTSEAGELELYFASASTNLNDPANWTPIATAGLTVNVGVEVTRFEWTGLPGAGHYCLVARWNTDGSPLSFSDIGDFVRGSNDVVWRNVNIVELGGDGDTSNVMMVSGDRRKPETFLMIQALPMDTRSVDWREMIRLELTIDKDRLGGKPLIDGLEPLGDGTYLIPHGNRARVLGPFLLKPGEQMKTTLRVREDLPAVKAAAATVSNPAFFEVTISQIRPEGVKLVNIDHPELFRKDGLVWGGVSYTLRLAP